MTLSEVQRIVDGQTPAPGASRLILRLADAQAAFTRADGSAGPGDIAVLLRQALLRYHLQSGGTSEDLRAATVQVPTVAPWPSDAFWARFGLRVVPVWEHRVRLVPVRWQPSWLDAGAGEAVEDAVAERIRRHGRAVPIDPIVRQYVPGLNEYLTPGQREAVRASFLTPRGASVIVNLPTGAGKTLAFQVAALRWRTENGIVAVIVPTVALARDQEARVRELVPDLERAVPLAYHSGLTTEEQSAVLAAVASGGMPIVFTSPEAALGPLRSPLHRAAESGRLKLFVIDEAHTVAQWGDDFRPQFQALSGLRADLLRASPPQELFRTLLLSATLTDEAYDALVRLFPSAASARTGGAPSCELVSEVTLRPEPAYLLAHAETAMERQNRVLEALHYLPRPLLLYTTKRADARDWEATLRNAGFHRVRSVVGGDMSTVVGEHILGQWRACALDVVVATSAFGLGMDQSNVRSVVHACLPETIDRYYQEVGRSGRDGRAAVALLVSEPSDLRIAAALAKQAIIGTNRAYERWQRMWTSPDREYRDGVHLVPLDAVPPRYTLSSERNRAWNLRTLGLMARAGLIEFAAPPLERLEQRPQESAADYEARWRGEVNRFAGLVGVRILDAGHQTRETFETRLRTVRTERLHADKDAFDLVRELTSLRRPLGDLFRHVYTLPGAGIEVARSRGSCPMTRTKGQPVHDSVAPPLHSFGATSVEIGARLAREFGEWGEGAPPTLWLSYEWPGDSRGRRAVRDDVLRALGRLAAEGIVEYVTPEGWLDLPAWVRLADLSPYRFVVVGDPVESPLSGRAPLPRVTVLDPTGRAADVEASMLVRSPHHLCVASLATRDPDRPDRYLADVRRLRPLSELLT